MTKRAQDVVEEIRALPDTEKLAVVDSILLELDRPDQEKSKPARTRKALTPKKRNRPKTKF